MLTQITLRRLLCGVLIVAALSTQALTQTETGQITGKVTDPGGATIAGATITIKSTATLSERNTATNSQGMYVLPNLQPALFEMTVSANGFAPVAQRVQVRVGSRNAINISLAVAAPADPNQKDKTP